MAHQPTNAYVKTSKSEKLPVPTQVYSFPQCEHPNNLYSDYKGRYRTMKARSQRMKKSEEGRATRKMIRKHKINDGGFVKATTSMLRSWTAARSSTQLRRRNLLHRGQCTGWSCRRRRPRSLGRQCWGWWLLQRGPRRAR